MKKLLILLTLISASFISRGQFIAKLINYSDSIMPPNCDKQLNTFGLFKIVMEEGTPDLKKGDTIFILQLCPREYMKRIIGKYKDQELYRVYLGSKVTPTYLQIAKQLALDKYSSKRDDRLWNGALRKYVQ